ncbi:MAG: cyclic nucleotide-binding domain-containing protein, partial [Myxococcales bacterium]|nr:cyclic nucleotide-binding domain-containing protein [Myxococcales bacterium]
MPTTSPPFAPDNPKTKQELRDYLRTVPFFEGLSEDLFTEIVSHADEIAVRAQHKVFRQDTNADAFFVVVEGEVAIEVPAIAGEPALVQKITPGHILGWSWVVPPYRWHFDARAEQPTRLVRIDGKSLLARCEEEPRLGYELLKRASALMMQRLEAAR